MSGFTNHCQRVATRSAMPLSIQNSRMDLAKRSDSGRAK